MKINLKRATLDDANMIGEVFDLYRIFYNQVPDISVAQQYIAERPVSYTHLTLPTILRV